MFFHQCFQSHMLIGVIYLHWLHTSLSGGLPNGPSQHVAPIEKKYPGVGHLPTSDSKRSADLEDTKDATTSFLDASQSIKPLISAVDPIPSLSLEARSHGEICLTEHDFENQQTAVLEGIYIYSQLEPHFGKLCFVLFTSFCTCSFLSTFFICPTIWQYAIV